MSKQAFPVTRELIHQFAGTLRSERTAKTYGSIAAAFLKFAGKKRPYPQDVSAFLARPLRSGRRAAIATYNQTLAAVRAFSRFAVVGAIWVDDPTAGLAFLREPERDPPVLFIPEIQAFFRAVPAVTVAQWCNRDRAVLAMLFVAGLRVSELARLDVSQVDVASSTLLAVLRKGGRVQNIPLEPHLLHLLQLWLDERTRLARSKETALIVSSHGTRISVRSIERLFERIRNHLGTPKHATPHTARHSFITLELALGADITVVSRLAGHASVATTMRYRHLVDAEPRAAVAKLAGVIPPELIRRVSDLATNGQEMTTLPVVPDKWSGNVRPANDVLDDQENLDDMRGAGRAA